MKNKLLLALSSLFLLVGCQQGDVTESPINSEPAKTEPTETEKPKTEPKTEPHTEKPTETEPEEEEPIDYFTHCLQVALGKYYTSFPAYEGAINQRAKLYESSEPVICQIDYTFEEEGTYAKRYTTALKMTGYTIQYKETSADYLALKQLDDYYYLCLQYYQDSDTSLTILTYLYQYRYAEWPLEDIVNFLGADIPEVEGTAFELQNMPLTDTSEGLLISSYGVDESYCETYKGLLEAEEYGFTVEVYNGSYYSSNGIIDVNFYFDTDKNVFVILAYLIEE